MAGRRWCIVCRRWVGGGVGHADGCPDRGEFLEVADKRTEGSD